MATVTSAAMNRGVQISFRDPAFNSFAYISRSGITRLYGSSIYSFHFWWLSILFPTTVVPFYNSTSSVQVFQLVHIFWLLGRWDLSSLSRGQTCTFPVETQSLNHEPLGKSFHPRHFKWHSSVAFRTLTKSWNYHLSLVLRYFSTAKGNLEPISPFQPVSTPWQPLICVYLFFLI